MTLRDVLFNELLKAIPENRGIGLMGGKAGVLLCLLYGTSPEEQNDYFAERVGLLVNSLINEINERESSGYTLKELIESLHALSKLAKDGLVEIDDTIFRETSGEINHHLLTLSSVSNFDNLHGAFYVLKYLIDSGELTTDTYDKFLTVFLENFFTDGEVNIKPVRFSAFNDNTAMNYSLSHGLAGKISILDSLVRSKNDVKLHSVLVKLIEHFLSLSRFENIDNGRAVFPSLLKSTSDLDFGPTRLAWCYGDLCSASTMLRVSSRLANNNYLTKCEMVLESLAKRRGLSNNGITDAPFCHGTAGVSYVFHKLYIQTGVNIFKEASDYWEAETETFYKMNKDIKALRLSNRRELENDSNCVGFLEGYAGIYLALSAKKYNCFSWDSTIFLS